jgi:protoheme IX farnesyltransferase
VPPLCGWAAVTVAPGSRRPCTCFAIVFYWTPPHFWALSAAHEGRVRAVGVPMMPVVRGEARDASGRSSSNTVLLVVLTLLPVIFGFFGAIYATAAVLLGATFLWRAVGLQRSADRRSALKTYLFSLAYLAALFCAMVADARL